MAAALTHSLCSPDITWLKGRLQKNGRQQHMMERNMETRRSLTVTAASKSSKKRSENLGLWDGGLSVPALLPREDELETSFLGDFRLKPAGGLAGLGLDEIMALQTNERSRTEEIKAVEVMEMDEGRADSDRKEGEREEEIGDEVVLIRSVEGTEETEVEYDLDEDEEEEGVLDEEEEEWFDREKEEEEEEEEEEESEYVEVWEGDLPPPTAEEEAELLREAEAEIAQLEREQLEKSEKVQETVLPTHVVKLERELAEMRARMEEMEEELLQLKGFGSGKNPREEDSRNRNSDGPMDNVDLESSWDAEDFESVKNLGLEANAGVDREIESSAHTFSALDRSGSDGEGLVENPKNELLVHHGEEMKDFSGVNSSSVRDRLAQEWEDDDLLEFEEEEESFANVSDDVPGAMSLEELTSELSHLKRKTKAKERAAELFFKDEDDAEDDEDGPKKRGLPAIMRCFDTAKIYVKAGDGGNGVVAFRREKYVPFGGPAGGTGGRGGDIYIVADRSLNSLLPFRKTVHFRAGRGSHGQGSNCHGVAGKDVEVLVPPGTLVRQVLEDGEEGPVLLEVVKPGQREMLLPGGRGGRGNAAFKTGRNRLPQLAENGEEGAEMWVKLELKLVADIGIVGVPNAGKSTLLSAISAAKPKVADYPFTTLVPNLGVAEVDFETLVVADVPGLLEGAHDGFGLGHEFLRHTERCRCLVHVVDGTRAQPEHDFEAICTELELFNPALASKPQVVVFNKMDVPDASENWPAFEEAMCRRGIKALPMSAVTGEGTLSVLRSARDLLKLLPPEEETEDEEGVRIPIGEQLRAQKRAAIEEFKIEADRHRRIFEVDGEGLRNFVQMTNWEYFEAVKRFQRVLDASGVNQALLEAGVRDGDTVVIGKLEFDWQGSEDIESLGDWKRGNRGTKVWPH